MILNDASEGNQNFIVILTPLAEGAESFQFVITIVADNGTSTTPSTSPPLLERTVPRKGCVSVYCRRLLRANATSVRR